jgi:hypothetical protein
MLRAEVKKLLQTTVEAIGRLTKVSRARYEPSKHYMRGPGPKTAAAGRSTPASGSDDAAASDRQSVKTSTLRRA